MASRGGKAAVPAGGAADVAGLVEAIRKHKKFKQLASYSIQCLEKVVNPVSHRVGWDINARQAFDLGAATDIAEVAKNFPTDTEIFSLSISSLTHMTNVPKCMGLLMSSAAAPPIVAAVAAYWENVKFDDSGAAEALSRMQPALSLMLGMARQDGAAFDAAGGIALLLSIAAGTKRPAPPSGGAGNRSSTASGPAATYLAFATTIASVASILNAASRSKGGLDAMARPANIAKLLQLATMNLAPADGGGRASTVAPPAGAKSATSPRLKRSASRSSVTADAAAAMAAAGGKDAREFNGHLESAFRILDRLARNDVGRENLIAAGATNQLSSIMASVARQPTALALAMSVLTRLLGRNIADLIDRISGVGGSGDLRERIMCSRLLAFMLRDVEYMSSMTASDGALIRRIVALIDASPLDKTDAAVALIQVLRLLADADVDNIPLLYDCGALPVVGAVLAKRRTDADVVAEAVGFFASMVDCPEMLVTLDTEGPTSAVQLSVTASLEHADVPSVALACLTLLERALFYDYSPEKLVGEFDAITFTLQVMKANDSDMHVQAAATAVLVGLAVSEAHVTSMMTAGLADVLINNLMGSASRAGVSSSEGDASPVKGGATSRPSVGGRTSGAAGADDDDEAKDKDAAGKDMAHIDAEVVASSLYLVTSLCAVNESVNTLKSAGIIRAVLAGFSRHTQDANVYKYFREVITALNISENEVADAVEMTAKWISVLQSAMDDSDALRPVNDYIARINSENSPIFATPYKVEDIPKGELPMEGKEVDLTGIAERVLESISLLEAVTVSPVFVAVIVARDGVPALLRVLGVVSVARLVAKERKVLGVTGAPAAAGKTTAASRAFGGASKAIATYMADDVLGRTANTLAHLARVSYEIEGNQVEQESEYEPVDFSEFDVPSHMFDRDTLAFVARAMNAAAKPTLKAFADAAITLMSWLASGHTHEAVAHNVDALVTAQCIEGCVSILRAHQSALDVCSAVAGALTRVAVAAKGATAVALRGGSRQVTRMLYTTAALRSGAGDDVLLAYLRLVDTCAAGSFDCPDLLRKQGVVEAIVTTVDAGTPLDFRGDDEVDEQATSDARKGQGGAGANSAASRSTAAPSYVPDAGVRAEIDATITSVLSRLVLPEQVHETVNLLSAVADDLRTQAIAAAYNPRKGLTVRNYAKAVIVRSIVRLGLFAGTEAAVTAGMEWLDAGVTACTTIAEACLNVVRAVADAGGASANVIEQELEVALPVAIRTIKMLLSVLYLNSGGAINGLGTATGVSAMRIILRSLEERPETANEVVSATAVLAANEAAAAEILKSNGLPILIDMLQKATDRNDEPAVRDGLLTLAGVAKVPGCARQVFDSGAAAVTQAWLIDGVNDASADTLAAAFLLLASAADDPSILNDMVLNGNIFESIRVALTRHCQDAYSPREPLLYSISLLMQRLGWAHEVITNPTAAEDFRNALRRVLRAGAMSTGYIDSTRCAVAIMDVVSKACVVNPERYVDETLAGANREAVTGADGEDFIVNCMSSSSADDSVLAAGYSALRAIGASERAARMLADIDAYAQRIPEWLDAGYDSNDPQVIDMVAGMSENMRALGAQIVVQGGSAPELGAPYADVLGTVWRAVACVCSDRVVSRRSTAAAPQAVGSAGKDLHQARADVLAVGSQICGRLQAAASTAAEEPGGPHTVPLPDLVSVLYTILAASHSVLEVRVIESMGRAAESVVELCGEQGLHALCKAKVIAGFVSLLQVVQSEMAKAKLAAGGYGGDATLSMDDLKKCEAAINATIKNITVKTRAALVGTKGVKVSGSSPMLADSEALADVMTAVAITTAHTAVAATAAGAATEGGEEGAEAPAKPAAAAQIDASATADINQLAEAIVTASARAYPDVAPSWALLGKAANGVEESMAGPARHGASGKAPMYTVTTLQSKMRVQMAMQRALTAHLLPAGMDNSATVPASQQRLEFMSTALNAAMDVAFDTGRKLRRGLKADAPDDTSDQYVGTEDEITGAKNAYGVASGVAAHAVRSAIDLMSRMQIGAGTADVEPVLGSTALTSALNTLSASRSALDNNVNVVNAISRMSDLLALDIIRGNPSAAARPARATRIATLAKGGVFRSALNALATASVGEVEQHSKAVVQMISKLMSLEGVTVQALALDQQSLRALQALVRRFPDDEALAKLVTPIVRGLESIYTEQSGAAFEGSIRKTVNALSAVTGTHRHQQPGSTQMFYSAGGATQWEPPTGMNAMLDALIDVDIMARRLDDEAVSAVDPTVVQGLVVTLQSHEHDPGVVSVCMNALGKLAANIDNHAALISSGALIAAAEAFRNNNFINEPRVCEGFASMVLPLSFEPEFVRGVLTTAQVIPILINIIVKYNKYCTKFPGSAMPWVPEHHPNHNKNALTLPPAEGPDAEERTKELPRLAQMCVQSLANLACDNEEDGDGQSSVTRIVDAGGIPALGELMAIHLDNPRLLEDSICALSNMAFVSDSIQLAIGSVCMDTVCSAATSFNGDSYLFQMTLRAIGNLTRCDENIMRAVGFGVIRGMVEGMTKHQDDPTVLQLCADVIGNMASVDDKKVSRDIGIGILGECAQRRRAPAAAAVPAPPPGGAAPRPPTAPKPPSAPKVSAMTTGMAPEALMELVKASQSLKEAVCLVLFEDGAPRALAEAMTRHFRAPDLAGSCLRALHYIGASTNLVTRMVNELSLVDQVVLIMRSIDYRPDVLRRGARVLGLVVGTEALKDRVLAAGAPVMLLQAIETHKTERELCISCYSVLAMARSPAVVTAVQEMQAVDTAVAVLRQNSQDHEFVGVLLELLWGWASDSDLAATITARAGTTLSQLLEFYASNTDVPDRLQHLNYLLNLFNQLARQRVPAHLLLSCGIVQPVSIVAENVIADNNGTRMLQQRSLVVQSVTLFLDLAKPPTGNKDVAPTVNTDNVKAIMDAGAGPMLERVLKAYKGVPDPKTPGQLLYDQSMCEKAYGVLHEMEALGYVGSEPITLDAPDDDAPSTGAAPAPAPSPAAAPVDTVSPAVTAGASLPAQRGGAPNLPPDAAAELQTLLGAGRVIELWSDKPRKARITVTPDYGSLTIAYEDKKEMAALPFTLCKGVLLGLPVGYKKKGGLFGGRNPKPERSIALEDASGNTVLHLEVDKDPVRGPLAVAIAGLAGVKPRV